MCFKLPKYWYFMLYVHDSIDWPAAFFALPDLSIITLPRPMFPQFLWPVHPLFPLSSYSSAPSNQRGSLEVYGSLWEREKARCRVKAHLQWDFQTSRIAEEWPESPVSKVLKLRHTTTEKVSRTPGLYGLKLKEAASKMIM